MRALVLAVLLACPLAASTQDRDRPGDNFVATVADACSGRFDRLPPRYYEMRVERLQGALAPSRLDNAQALGAADNLCVALLRLGRFPAALQVLDRKAAALEGLRGRDALLFNAHSNRTLKNRAMCLLARWRQGGDARDLEAALALVQRAAKEAPHISENALLAREFEFWRRAQPPTDGLFPNLLGIREVDVRAGRPGALQALRLPDAITHLARRVTYGGEYQSADLFYALSLACAAEGRTGDAGLCWARLCDLIESGARVHAQHSLGNDALKRATASHLGSADLAGYRRRLEALKREAATWAKERGAMIAQALERGEHPDTMPTFWTRWMEQEPAPEPDAFTALEPEEDAQPLVGTALWIGGVAAALFLFLVVGGLAIYFARRHPAAPSVDEL